MLTHNRREENGEKCYRSSSDASPGRPRIFDDPVGIKLYLERGELDSIEILAHINGNSIRRELRLAVQRHLAVGLDDSNTPTRTELAGRPGQGAAA